MAPKKLQVARVKYKEVMKDFSASSGTQCNSKSKFNNMQI